MAQLLRPIADTSIGNWTDQVGATTNLYAALDESVADTADYARSEADPSSDTLRLKLTSSVIDPGVSSGYAVNYTIGKQGSGPVNLTVRIVEGASTEIVAWDHVDIAAGPTEINQTLLAAEADAITDHTNLYIEFIATLGVAYVFRDQFDGSIDGAWTITGTATTVDNQLSIIGTGTWGDERLKHTAGLARQAGRTVAALVIPEDRAAEVAVGWATGVVADPTTDGHSWLNIDGHFNLATPGTMVYLSGTGNDSLGSQRTIEYLVAVALRDQGAFYLISTFADYLKIAAHSRDEIGIPQYPDARVMWVEDTDTTATLYPIVSAGSTLGYTDGHRVDDFRVVDVADWTTDQSFLAFLDRFDRADSATSLGGSWAAASGNGVWGISSGEAYFVSGSGFNHIHADSGLAGDGLWRCKITAPTTTSDGFGFVIRRVDANNFVRVWNNGGNAITIQTWVAGGFDAQIASYPVTWVAGQTYDIVVGTVGANYCLYLDGAQIIQWIADPNSRHLTGTGMGPYTSTNPTGCRWDDFMTIPHTIALPPELQDGAAPHIFTPGSILMQDSFTGTDGDPISGRTPDTVGTGTWEVIGTGFEISGNSLINTNIDTVDADYFAIYDVGVSDVEITATVTSPSVDDIIRSGIAVRVTSASDSLRARMFMHPSQPNNDEVEIWEFNTPYDSNDFHKQWLANFYALSTTYTLKVQIVGQLMHFFIDGQPVVSYHLVGIHNGTKFGIYHNSQDDGCIWHDITIRALS